jgi:hypothetical protein
MVNIHWAHSGPSFVASFLACLVECVEALTVVLAVGSVRSWSGALRYYVVRHIRSHTSTHDPLGSL